jgi:NTP pyrophosphatase (non-canonical NTP hydrolase)
MIDYDINDLTVRIYAWFDEKGLHDPVMQFAKLNEEVGEMAHELTRGRKDSEEMKDAIGDVFVTLVGMAHHLDMDLSECINMAYKEIRKRTGKVIEGSFVKDGSTN